MKNIFRVFLLFILVNMQAQTEQEMQAWMAYMTPSKMHQELAKYNGEWKTTITMWMDATSEPIKSEGSTQNNMILGGRYQESVYKGNFNGMPMEGKSLLAYDNHTKEFISTWIDNFGTGLMVMKGKYHKDQNAIVLIGEMVDPITGKMNKVRQIHSFMNGLEQKMEMYMTMPKQKEFKTMEIHYQKKINTNL